MRGTVRVFKTVWLPAEFRKFATAVVAATVSMELATVAEVESHGRPSDPREADKSMLRSSHFPRKEAAWADTTGRMLDSGAANDSEVDGMVGHEAQDDSVHCARSTPLRMRTWLPGTTAARPATVTDKFFLLIQLHSSEAWSATTTTDEQGNTPNGILPKSVGDSKVMKTAVPSKLNTAALTVGGGETAPLAATEICMFPPTKDDVNSPADVPDSTMDRE